MTGKKNRAPKEQKPADSQTQATQKEANPAAQGYKSFSEVDRSIKLEGARISTYDLANAGERFVVHHYYKLPSKFAKGIYAAAQIERPGGEKAYFESASPSLMEDLDRANKQFGGSRYTAKIVKRQSQSTGKEYLRLG